MQSQPPIPATDITPAHIIINTPHLLDNIFRHASTSALASCLRASTELHSAAGKFLYHTVRVDSSNLPSFLLGARIGLCTDGSCFADGGLHATWNSIEKTLASRKQSLPRHNFKARLLAHVRVLSLGSHEGSMCIKYSWHARSLFSHLDTLRIAPTPVSAHKLKQLCDYKHRACPLFEQLAPRKLVFRNLEDSTDMLCDWPLNRNFCSDRLEEIVYVMPTNGNKYGAGELGDKGEMFFKTPPARGVKVIYTDEWEVWRPFSSQNDPLPAAAEQHKRRPWLLPSEVIEVVRVWCRHTTICNTVYGLEKVAFRTGMHRQDPNYDYDFLALTFYRHFPHTPLKDSSLLQLVKDELHTNTLTVARSGEYYEGPRGHPGIKFRTLEDYAALPESERLGELDDGLEVLL